MEMVSSLLIVCLSTSAALQQSVDTNRCDQIPVATYQQALDIFQQGDYAGAEVLLRPALRACPYDSRALGLLGVVLDAQRKFDQAEIVYGQARLLTPHSATLLNNIGNHYLALGDLARAREAYLSVVALEPGNPNADLQLAEMSVRAKEGNAALRYLGHLPEDAQRQPSAQLLRAQALHLTGQQPAAEALLEQTESQAGNDPRTAFSVGMVFVKWERYEAAERAFSSALQFDPTSFEILYNLGLAALHAHHFERAVEVFEIALKQKPDDVDTLYDLARTYAGKGSEDHAIILLVQAQGLAPARADILLFLAQTASSLGYSADAAGTLDRYLKLRPDDDVARRERGFALAHTARLNDALEDLRWYVRKHPKNARGLYELGVTETVRERDKALAHLTEAVALDPDLTAARYARAILNSQEGRTNESIADLKIVIQRDPKDYRALDALGKDYLALDKTPEAVAALDQATTLAPNDPKILLHYSQALTRAGRREEAGAVVERFRDLGPQSQRARPYGGLLDFLSLSPQEQSERYVANVRRRVAMNPNDVKLQVRLGEALLGIDKIAEAREAFRRVLALDPDTQTLLECGRVLLYNEQYDLARECLDRAVSVGATDVNTRLDLAISLFHTVDPSAALAELDKIAIAQRNGDYYLLRAEILDARGAIAEAEDDLNRGLRAAPTRPDLYFQSALFLIKHGQYQKTLDLLTKALQVVPESPELLVIEAITYELLEQRGRSEEVLMRVESQWPEWSLPYLLRGIISETHFKWTEGKSQILSALALGPQDAAAYYWLALADTSVEPADIPGATKAIAKSLELDGNNPYSQSLAGKIALGEKRYPAALDYLTAAVRLDPDLSEAHESMSAAYRAIGEKEKAIAELKEVLRIKQKYGGTIQGSPAPAAITNLLFRVRPPAQEEPNGSP
jgi:tetratricopeptide (TPR) repeat protein